MKEKDSVDRWIRDPAVGRADQGTKQGWGTREGMGGEELQNELCVDWELLYGDERDDPRTGGAQRGPGSPTRTRPVPVSLGPLFSPRDHIKAANNCGQSYFGNFKFPLSPSLSQLCIHFITR